MSSLYKGAFIKDCKSNSHPLAKECEKGAGNTISKNMKAYEKPFPAQITEHMATRDFCYAVICRQNFITDVAIMLKRKVITLKSKTV